MAYYKLILRTQDPTKHKLHIEDYYCEAADKNGARAIFESNFGLEMPAVYGPIQVDSVPAGTTLLVLK